MTEYCKHGIDMQQTCRKCGRTKVIAATDFGYRSRAFTDSIKRLEDTVRRMEAELTSGPPPRQPPGEGPDEVEAPEQRPAHPTIEGPYPWERRG